MFNICKHKWEIVDTDYTEPVKNFSAARCSSEMVERAMSGITHIYMKCIKCGNVKEKEVLGKFNYDKD